MSKGPLSVGWGTATLEQPQAGAVAEATVELENTGALRWGERIFVAYHWLDLRGNPIVWDGIRTVPPPLEPGERANMRVRVRAPIPPGPYRLAFDLVAEGRAWFSELGDPQLTVDVDVRPRTGEPNAELPAGVEPSPDWADRVRAAHAEGYAVVAGAIAWTGGAGRRRPHALEPYLPGAGRQPAFPEPLLCPSVLDGVSLERLTDVVGLPAFAAPRDEPWLYDGRIVLQVRR